jgi:putative NIF3 family GTP cyclohydrolase 1 type 2
MDLKKVVKYLEEFADLNTSLQGWDNVGLLVEPSEPLLVNRILLTIDLTQSVVDEALKMNANLIISYHPVIFKPFLSRLTNTQWNERCLVKCIENRIAIFSPHTSWDSINGGINDWLLSPFNLESIETATKVEQTIQFDKNLKFTCSSSDVVKFKSFNGVELISKKE